MSFTQFLSIIRARWRTLVIVLLSTVALTVLLSLVLPRQYTAVASVLVDVKPDPIAGTILSGMLTPSIMATQVDILTSDRVSRRVIKNLKLDQDPKVRAQWQEETDGQGTVEDWLGEAFEKKLDVKPSKESNVITVSFKWNDPKFAAGMVNAFVQAYLDTSVDLRNEPARQYTSYFEGRAKEAHDAVERAQQKLTQFQKDNGIVNGDERLDLETSRLNDLSAQLVLTQAQAADANNRAAQIGRADQSQEALNSPVLAGMKVDLSRAQAHLEELRARYGENHPTVQEARANIAELRVRLDNETRRIGGSLNVSSSIGRGRESEVRGALEAQREKVLKAKQARDQMLVMQHDVESAQRTYDGIILRKDQTALESQTQQTNVNVLTPATPPIDPSFPRWPLNIAASILLGCLLGVCLVMVNEMRDRRIRSTTDLVEALGMPILGVLPAPARSRKRRPALMAQRVISGRLKGPSKGIDPEPNQA